MPTTDRTNEFRACVDSIRTRAARVDPLRRAPGARDAQLKQGLLAGSHTANGHGPRKQQSKSEFARMAAAIGKDIASTTTKLDKLAQCALSSLFLRELCESWSDVFNHYIAQIYSGKAEDTLR